MKRRRSMTQSPRSASVRRGSDISPPMSLGVPRSALYITVRSLCTRWPSNPSPTPVPDATATRLVAERAYLELRDRIVTLHLPPGTVLREDELMDEMGIGRTPLREAVKRLALENLVAVQPRRGTFVSASRGRRHRRTSPRCAPSSRVMRRSWPRCVSTPRHTPPPRRSCTRSSISSTGRPGLADALRRAHPPLHLGGRPQPISGPDARALLHALAANLVRGARPRAGLGHAVHDQTQLLEAVLDRNGPHARTIMREHVLAFQREILAAFSRT